MDENNGNNNNVPQNNDVNQNTTENVTSNQASTNQTQNNASNAKKSGGAGKAITITVISLIIVLVIAAIAIFAVKGFSNIIGGNNGKDGNTVVVTDNKQKVKIKKSETSSIKYDTFNNGLVSFEYPAGWKVEVAPADYIHYSFKVYNPQDPSYMFLFGLKQEGNLKSEKARQTYAKLYPDAIFSKLTPIDPQTTEAFYKAWDKNYVLGNESINSNFLPAIKDFKVVSNLGKDTMGGDILRATYTNSNGKKCEGLFTASVKSVGTYYISEDIWNPLGPQVDVSPLNTYNIVMMSAPENELNEWQKSLDHCLSTIQFSQSFINGFNQQEDTIVKTIQANQKVYDQMSDMIMDSWEKRNNSYDIISQKQSDATLGYERVYDTETGDIYKAYNGFTDDYSGDRYKAITDDMYTKPTSGYIEK